MTSWRAGARVHFLNKKCGLIFLGVLNAHEIGDDPADFGLPHSDIRLMPEAFSYCEKWNLPFFGQNATVAVIIVHSVVAGDHDLITFNKPFRQIKREQAIHASRCISVLRTVIAVTMPGIVHIHGVYQQKIWIVTQAQYFRINQKVAIGVVVRVIKHAVLNWQT